MKLRYTGAVPVTFVASVGEVEPGAEFTVDDDAAESFTGRSDIDVVQDAAPRVRKTAKAAADEPTTTDTTVTDTTAA